MCVCANFPAPYSPSFLLVEGRAAGVRAPSAPCHPRTPSSSPLSARQLGSGLRGTPGCGGLTFTLYPSPPNPTPPLSVAPAIHMQATHHPPILSFHLSTPGQAVVSRLKFKSLDRPGRPGPRQATTDQTWQAAGTGGGRVTSVWLLIF